MKTQEPNLAINDFTCNGECSRCGACCSDLLPLSSAEIKTMQRWVKKHHFKPTKRSGSPVAGLILDATCPFMVAGEDGKASCAIYNERPKICRMFLCKGAKEGTLPVFPHQRAYKVVSVRQTVFHDSTAMSFIEHVQLLNYIQDRNKEEQ